MSTIEKFDRLARGYAAHDYADPARYSTRRAEVALELGPRVPDGASILDLGCGDANMAEPLLARGYRYRGVDGSAKMIEEARARLGGSVPLEVSLIDRYEPPEPVDLTLCLRAFYYPSDRIAFLRHVLGYTRTKLVFDFDPRAFDRRPIEDDLRAAGFDRLVFRPFFLPQRAVPSAPIRAALYSLEHTGPIARAALRVRGIWFCAAARD